MRIKASYTVENAVIVPMFMIIIVVMLRVCCNMHDELIKMSVNSQVVVQAELNDFDRDDEQIYNEKASHYLKERTIFLNDYKVDGDSSLVKTNSPEKAIRIFNALRKLGID